jgi:hypothetical protein
MFRKIAEDETGYTFTRIGNNEPDLRPQRIRIYCDIRNSWYIEIDGGTERLPDSLTAWKIIQFLSRYSGESNMDNK